MKKEFTLGGIRFRYTGIGKYWVSECGDVLSYYNNEIKLLKPFVTNGGHLKIELKISPGKAKKFLVHRLVYEAFNGKLNDDLVIEHLDSNPKRNYYKNLKQSTQSENIKTAVKAGHWNQNKRKVLVYDYAKKEYRIFDSVKEIYTLLNIPYNNGSLHKLIKHRKFHSKFEFIKYFKRGEGPTTIERIG